jgi:hypothetical protein
VDRGTTANPWPSSDWIAFVSERGTGAAIALLLVFGQLALVALGRLRTSRDPESALQAGALLATLTAALIAGAFDAVLLLAVPALIVWSAAGVLSAEPGSEPEHIGSRAISAAVLLVVGMAGLGALRSGSQLTAMAIHDATDRPAWLGLAAHIDPGSYRIHLQLAQRGGSRADRCAHARAAHALYPLARIAERLDRSCN